MLFWINKQPAPRIERAMMDGSNRRTIVSDDIFNPVVMTVDPVQDIIFWADMTLKRIERANLDGGNRVVLRDGLAGQPVAMAVHDNFLYWADVGSSAVYKIDKLSGLEEDTVKRHVKHLSAMASVGSYPDYKTSPCYNNRCSHLCLVDEDGKSASCSCPSGSGLILNQDDLSCGLPPTCKTDEFTCVSGATTCIPQKWRCDRMPECADFSDEIDCPYCPLAGQFLCLNGDCVNATLICDGTSDCPDDSDEDKCCGKDQFRCNDGQCIEGRKACDGKNDCNDNSDETLPCKIITGATPLNSRPSADSNVVIPVVVSLVVVIGFVICVILVCYWKKRTLSSEARSKPDGVMASNNSVCRSRQFESQDFAPPVLPHRHHHHHHHTQAPPPPPTSNMMASSTGAVMPLDGDDDGLSPYEQEAGSSNGVMYDRNHVTGASSSTSSSAPGMQHPPSPATIVRGGGQASSVSTMPHHHHHRHNHHHHQQRRPYGDRRGRHHQGHLSMHSLNRHNRDQQYRFHNHPHPPTPCSTDINDESDVYMHSSSVAPSGVGAIPPARMHFTSAANSTYEDSDAGVRESAPLYRPQRSFADSSNADGGNGGGNSNPFFHVNSASVLPEPPPPPDLSEDEIDNS